MSLSKWTTEKEVSKEKRAVKGYDIEAVGERHDRRSFEETRYKKEEE